MIHTLSGFGPELDLNADSDSEPDELDPELEELDPELDPEPEELDPEPEEPPSTLFFKSHKVHKASKARHIYHLCTVVVTHMYHEPYRRHA